MTRNLKHDRAGASKNILALRQWAYDIDVWDYDIDVWDWFSGVCLYQHINNAQK